MSNSKWKYTVHKDNNPCQLGFDILQLLPDEKPHSNHLPDGNTLKFSSQSFPNCF